MSKLTHNPTGRPAGRRDTKKRKLKDTAAAKKARSLAAKRAAATRKKQREQKAATLQGHRPAVETSDVKVTPYPRTGDSPEFVEFIDQQRRVKAQAEQTERTEQLKSEQPPQPVELLQVADVAEWVAWPFMIWGQANDLPSLMLSSTESRELAEPLTSICNRHGVGDLIPPDLLDGLKFFARATPVMTDRFKSIKAERIRRGDGSSQTSSVTGRKGVRPGAQGAPMTAPKEV